jgi:hypothetical protein
VMMKKILTIDGWKEDGDDDEKEKRRRNRSSASSVAVVALELTKNRI